MTIVREVIDSYPSSDVTRVISRDEVRLFEKPDATMMRFITAETTPLAVYGFPAAYEPVKFAPPRGVFEGGILRLEWQTMDGRQPFYHRNTDVDEVGFQVCGLRTQMTELGTLDIQPGQFTKIPVGVGHDNYGREDIHLILYMHGPAEPCLAPVAEGAHRIPPFEGWKERAMLEITTHCLGGPHCDVASSMIDEHVLLDAVQHSEERMQLLQTPGSGPGLQWVYKAPKVWIGETALMPGSERTYTRHLAADEIQYQVSGTRTLVSQRGAVKLGPGDFIRIPFGCAFTSLCEEPARHLSVLTAEHVPAVRDPTRYADLDPAAVLRDAPAPEMAQ